MATGQLPISRLSDDLSFFTDSNTVDTASSSSTTWGPGALSGKALKAFGETSLDLLCRVIIRRRLAFIRQTLERSPAVLTNPVSAKDWRQRDAIYSNLEELCRGDYSLSLRRAAANLLSDIVSLISRFLAKSFFDEILGFAPNPKRLTSLFSTPKHTQWASLLSHIQRHEPLLFAEHGPFISVRRWSPGTLREKSTIAAERMNIGSESDAVCASGRPQSHEPNSKSSGLVIAVTVEVTQTQEIQEASMMTKASGFRSWLARSSLRTICSRSHHDRNSKQTVSRAMDRLTACETGPFPFIGYEPKVLVLGAGGVGKSTLIKQQKHASLGKPSDHQPDLSREIIVNNTIASMKSLLLNVPSSGLHPSLLEAKRYILELPWASYDVDNFSATQLLAVGRMIRSLWRDPEIRKAAQRKRALLSDDLFVAPDSLEYLCDSVDRIFAADYKPTFHDAVRARICTVGIHETILDSNSGTLSFIDTGGERSERRKQFGHRYENVSAILFVVALSDYNGFFYDESTSCVNRMDDSLSLFQSIVNCPHFANALITLIFNKGDVFAKELENNPLNQWRPDYKGETYEDACRHIEKCFIDFVEDKNRALQIHYTTAVDEKAMMAKSILIRDEITGYYQQQQLGIHGYAIGY
ncbi:G-protein alpha subunit-domain-containing protein [Gautieria morchelliformis]|nr:G-protein alpha subunit-domain-containing protein [Gautieria morchelliformis]